MAEKTLSEKAALECLEEPVLKTGESLLFGFAQETRVSLTGKGWATASRRNGEIYYRITDAGRAALASFRTSPSPLEQSHARLLEALREAELCLSQGDSSGAKQLIRTAIANAEKLEASNV